MPTNCACGSQIVWFFDKPTIYACTNCEITVHFEQEKCPQCRGEITAFVANEPLPDED